MEYIILVLIAVNINTVHPSTTSKLLENRYSTPDACKEAGEALIKSIKEKMDLENSVILVKCLKADDVKI